MMNYKNAPPLKPLDDYSTLMKDDEETLESLLVWQGKGKLNRLIGNKLISVYKKTDPKQQSIWNSDTSRMSYAIMNPHMVPSDWTIDKKGIKTGNIIIDPFLEHIKNIVARHLVEKHSFIKKNPNECHQDILGDMDLLAKIVVSINNNSLSCDVNRYIASSLHINKDNNLLTDNKTDQNNLIEDVTDDQDQ